MIHIINDYSEIATKILKGVSHCMRIGEIKLRMNTELTEYITVLFIVIRMKLRDGVI